MASINMGNMKDYLGKKVFYLTSWGYEGEGTLTSILGNGHVEIKESEGDSIITSVQNAFISQRLRSAEKQRRERMLAKA